MRVPALLDELLQVAVLGILHENAHESAPMLVAQILDNVRMAQSHQKTNFIRRLGLRHISARSSSRRVCHSLT
jgi:hypothetical protein